MAEEKSKVSLGQKIKKFFRDYKSEFKKISWPTMSDSVKSAVVVLIAIAVISVCIFLVDTGLSKGITGLSKLL